MSDYIKKYIQLMLVEASNNGALVSLGGFFLLVTVKCIQGEGEDTIPQTILRPFYQSNLISPC